MPRGHHMARCHHCGKEWMVGDCIPSTCDECEKAGHRGLSIDCPKCNLGRHLTPVAMSQDSPGPQTVDEARAYRLRGRWVKKKWIETPDGAYSGTCKACLHGAAAYIGGEFGPELSRRLESDGCTVEWNDASERTEDEVLAALADRTNRGEVFRVNVVLYGCYPADGAGAGQMPVSLLACCQSLDGLVMPIHEAIECLTDAAETLIGETVDDRMSPVDHVEVKDHGDFIVVELRCGPKTGNKLGDLCIPGPRFVAWHYVPVG